MYRLLYRLRIIITVLIVAVSAGGIVTYILTRDYETRLDIYYVQATSAVESAVQNALHNATRTAEAPQNRYHLVTLGQNTDLNEVAQQYETTLELIQIVNGLPTTVTEGSGETIIVPQGIKNMDPLRLISTYRAQPGDTLAALAEANNITLSQIRQDNPVLAQRGLLPGDIVFIGTAL